MSFCILPRNLNTIECSQRSSDINRLALLTLAIFSCSSPETQTGEIAKSFVSKNYDVLSEDKYETGGKANF